MAWRRIVLFCLLLVVIGAIASATVPRERRAPAEQPFPPAATGAPADVVAARLPSSKEVRAEVGDVLRVRVAHDAEDVVQVPTLGISEPVEPGIDAQLVFDADQPGRFAVILRDANKRIGTIDVKQPG
jgi:protein involved in polysaccharide export with SLBB domain